MRDFTIYVAVDDKGKMGIQQEEQFALLLDAVLDRRIKVFWLIGDNTIKVRQIINIIRSFHKACKHKDIIIRNEIWNDDRSLSHFAKILMKHVPVSIFEEKKALKEDYISLGCNNAAQNCMFNSCLGNTVYIQNSAELTICPHSDEIVLNRMTNGAAITSIYDTDDFRAMLLRQIEKRKICHSVCGYYNNCHGGCPIQCDKENCMIIEEIERQEVASYIDQDIRHLANIYRG